MLIYKINHLKLQNRLKICNKPDRTEAVGGGPRRGFECPWMVIGLATSSLLSSSVTLVKFL